MLTYQNSKNELEKINPFMEWKLIDRDLRITIPTALNRWDKKENTIIIPLSRMNFYDSVFIDVSKTYYNKLKKIVLKDRPDYLRKLKIAWVNEDPKYKRPGVRIWTLKHEHKINKASFVNLAKQA